ncbi:ribbon-helix-helix domain-containing protein [Bacillus sp. FJAT-22090]|uniref:ribbon-helix-helix domain-containing protein n=1 Tax=Bacillus sp. FJAT-22090 TaxID=1581038 RepID=UPI0011AA8EED|nr:ribbon-helix-helix domain-containing protein [Bacillus sp. FJAT-22090]
MSKRESFGSTMDAELLCELRELSSQTGIPISKLIDRAVKLLINDMNEASIPRDMNIRQ